ncbi:MAG: 5'-nucleotidase C-terminal domain-containing protein [Prolixibacteraceae bacterium]|nr:5'-nucleotidase C-terminal domain-containing protein [Prolixibacteraceae bacterium]
MQNSGVPQSPAFVTLTVGNVKATLLGLIETSGKSNAIIPSSHPWKVKDFIFMKANDIVTNFLNTKNSENADLFIALSHLGYNGGDGKMGDLQLASKNYFFDLIIGGHSHQQIDTTVNTIPIFQAGAYLHNLGKIELILQNRKIQSVNYHLIHLDNYTEYDAPLAELIDNYENLPELDEVIGHAAQNLSRPQVGCFYTDALRIQMNVDVAFQNTEGVLAGLKKGDITKREIYEISPFNNGTIIYKMTVAQIKEFLIGSGS